MRPLEKLTDEELHQRHVAAVACSLDGRNRVRALETPVFGGDRTGNRDADRRRALEAEIFADAESDAVVRELVIRKDLAQLGAGTLALTGPRFTAVWDDRSPLAGSHGQVLFAVRATQELGSAYVDLRRNAGRTNMSRAVRAPGEWLGSTCGWSHTNLGRVQIERELRRNDLRDTRRFQVRLLAESGDAFLEAAAARPAA